MRWAFRSSCASASRSCHGGPATGWRPGRAWQRRLTLLALLGAAVLVGRDRGGHFRLVTDAAWAPALDLRWHLGVDGISLPFAVLTALLVFCCSLYTVRVRPEAGRLRAFVAIVLLLEVGMVGTFLALNLLLFFLFFEIVLVPMWFLIAWWGDPHDQPGRTRQRPPSSSTRCSARP